LATRTNKEQNTQTDQLAALCAIGIPLQTGLFLDSGGHLDVCPAHFTKVTTDPTSRPGPAKV
jgi:hypothetical protein